MSQQGKQTGQTARLERFRANRDKFFREHENSPLLPEQREAFDKLQYYPEDPALRFEVELDTTSADGIPVEVDTTTGEKKLFTPAGTIEVTINGQPVSLLVYREPGRGRYFLPFRDATAGSETYGAGRYIDPQETPKGTLIVDFNYAYSPYCAYNDQWTCPIPPMQNRLPFPIYAGERAFKKAEHTI